MERYLGFMNGNIIVWRWQYYLKWSIDSLQSHHNPNGIFCRYGKADPQIPMALQGGLNNQSNIKNEEQC